MYSWNIGEGRHSIIAGIMTYSSTLGQGLQIDFNLELGYIIESLVYASTRSTLQSPRASVSHA